MMPSYVECADGTAARLAPDGTCSRCILCKCTCPRDYIDDTCLTCGHKHEVPK